MCIGMIVNELKYLLHMRVMGSMYMSDTCVEYLHVMIVIMYVHTCYMQCKTYCGSAVFLHVMLSFVVTLHTLTQPIATVSHKQNTITSKSLFTNNTKKHKPMHSLFYINVLT